MNRWLTIHISIYSLGRRVTVEPTIHISIYPLGRRVTVESTIHISIYPLGRRVTVFKCDTELPNSFLGATRNVIIRGIHPSITEERIREHLDHIHNLVIISISFEDGDAYISLNSINNSLFARTCMMSRVTYKGMKIEWYFDECSQPLPKSTHFPKKENQPLPQPKKSTSAMNRFQMLNMDGAEDKTSDESEETDEEPTVLSGLSSMNVSNRRSPWNPRTVAA